MPKFMHLTKYYSQSKYNVIILAGGLGTRMGEASQYIPKALSQIGALRAIDHIVTKYDFIAHKLIIGVSSHHDLLSAYIRGNYGHLDIAVCHEKSLINTSRSLTRCLDYADSSFPTIVQFCDLVLDEPADIEPDMLFVVNTLTSGVVGTFRHGVIAERIVKYESPIKPDLNRTGLCGLFTFADTPLLKAIAYGSWDQHSDITDDIVVPYRSLRMMRSADVVKIYEFGSQDDLDRVKCDERFLDD